MYFRGSAIDQAQVDRQLEDNLTKSLINLLEHSDKNILKDFLIGLGIIISTEDIIFDLQVANSGSRPDALIRTNDFDIYIESKYGASFDNSQLQNHIKNTDGYILYISKQKYSEELTVKYLDNKVVFINWIDISKFLIEERIRKRYSENTTTHFLIHQFIEYMEELNMVPFNGWNDRDFEAFLSTENENLRVAEDERKRVKDKLEQFLNNIKTEIEKKCDFYSGCKLHIGNLDKNHAWGAIKFNDGKLIDQIHISVIISPGNLSIGVQIEGNTPTKFAVKNIKNNREKFQIILKKLVNFQFVIRKRYQIQASNWKSDVVSQILLGNEITHDDVDYIINKMEQYNYVEMRIARIYDKHVVTKKGKKIMEESTDSILLLNELIQFLK